MISSATSPTYVTEPQFLSLLYFNTTFFYVFALAFIYLNKKRVLSLHSFFRQNLRKTLHLLGEMAEVLSEKIYLRIFKNQCDINLVIVT